MFISVYQSPFFVHRLTRNIISRLFKYLPQKSPPPRSPAFYSVLEKAFRAHPSMPNEEETQNANHYRKISQPKPHHASHNLAQFPPRSPFLSRSTRPNATPPKFTLPKRGKTFLRVPKNRQVFPLARHFIYRGEKPLRFRPKKPRFFPFQNAATRPPDQPPKTPGCTTCSTAARIRFATTNATSPLPGRAFHSRHKFPPHQPSPVDGPSLFLSPVCYPELSPVLPHP